MDGAGGGLQGGADGRWELQGGMWVEADCNIVSGESLVRQFLHGQLFYREHFGRCVENLWLPDVFGYSAALPQIMRLCGCRFFLAQKISWSQYNKFPHHSFIWQGIDGSRVLTHFPPEDTYSCEADPIRRTHGQDNYAQADVAPLFASLIGLGDGGGGPAEGHLERELRVRRLEGCPPSRFSRAADFFNTLERFQDRLPVWEGGAALSGDAPRDADESGAHEVSQPPAGAGAAGFGMGGKLPAGATLSEGGSQATLAGAAAQSVSRYYPGVVHPADL